MSQHQYVLNHNGASARVLMGWDRPLQGFFLVVSSDAEDDDWLYTNLGDPELFYCGGLPGDLEYFRAVLASLDIALPPRMLLEVERDREINCGNRSVVYGTDGNIMSDSAQR
jgi:hypothetical protein